MSQLTAKATRMTNSSLRAVVTAGVQAACSEPLNDRRADGDAQDEPYQGSTREDSPPVGLADRYAE
jgi:hypothetical protein